MMQENKQQHIIANMQVHNQQEQQRTQPVINIINLQDAPVHSTPD